MSLLPTTPPAAHAAPRGRMHSHRPLSQLLCPLDTLHLTKLRRVWKHAIAHTIASQRFGLGVFSSQARQWKQLYTSRYLHGPSTSFTIGCSQKYPRVKVTCWHLIVLVNLFLWIGNLGHLHCHPHEIASHLPENRKLWKLLGATPYSKHTVVLIYVLIYVLTIL